MNVSRVNFLSKYKVIGFDMDHTFLRYNLNELIPHIYRSLTEYLIVEKNYPRDAFSLDFENHERHFIATGLFIDVQCGNVLKIDEDRVITHGYYGSSAIQRERLEELYGSPPSIPDVFENPELKERFRIEMSFFGSCNALIYSQILEAKRREQKDADIDYLDVYKEMRYGLERGYGISCDEDHETSLYFKDVVHNPQTYLHDPSLTRQWITGLQKQGYKFFLVTNSQFSTTQRLMSSAHGENWMDMFDFTVVNSRKPGFFSNNEAVLKSVSNEDPDGTPSDKIEYGKIYRQGSFEHVVNYFNEKYGFDRKDFLFVGDHYLTDTYVAKTHGKVDTITIMEEMMLYHGLTSKLPLTNKIWGSHFFVDSDETKRTFWLDFVRKHSTYIIPHLDYLASDAEFNEMNETLAKLLKQMISSDSESDNFNFLN